MYLVEQCTDPNFSISNRDNPKDFKWDYVARLNGTFAAVKEQVESYMIRTRHSYRISDWNGQNHPIVMQISRRQPRPPDPYARPVPNLWSAILFPQPNLENP